MCNNKQKIEICSPVYISILILFTLSWKNANFFIMDIKSEVDIKDELLESSDDFIYNVQRFEQVSVLEEIQENMFYPSVDVKEEIEMKSLQHEDLFYPGIDVKEEIELKIDPLYIKEEYSESGYHVDQISGLDGSQHLTILH
ncbi:hypothetical protein Anas_09091 [Armadillidium nasatum]|uniref:Uncharacterized protein n=1 Tax=Armadillidium nasatum TaxID=96803 RepID=A0A5N5TE42_9CRUS|nr:hypothetical protein Anas_09091 [Armadillidium nasatum]